MLEQSLLTAGGGSLLLLTGWRIVKPTWETIPEEEVYIIYRRGCFHRVLKAGVRCIYRGLETVERIINIRDQPVDFAIPDLYAYDIPLGYTINFWYRLDPVAVAGNDRHELRELVQFDNDERHEQIRLCVKDLFIKYITEFQRSYRLPQGANDMEKLYPFAPGQPAYQFIIAKVQQDLSTLLTSFGAILSSRQPVMLKSFHLPSSMVTFFERERNIRSLQRNFPGMSPDMALQFCGALEGANFNGYQHLVVTNEDRSYDTQSYQNGNGHLPTNLSGEEIAQQHNMHRKPPRVDVRMSGGKIEPRVRLDS